MVKHHPQLVTQGRHRKIGKKSTNDDNGASVMDICKKMDKKIDTLIIQLDKIESRLSKVEKLQLSQEAKLEKNQSRISDLEKEQVEQKASLNFLHGEMDDARKVITEIKSEMASLANKNSIVAGMKDTIDKLEQEKSYQNLLLCGIPKTTNEDLMKIISKLSTQMKVELTPTEISTVYRTKSNNIYVKFTSQITRDKIYNSRKNLQKQKITTKSLGFDTEENIYINEVLDDGQRELFYQARCKKKTAKYRYIWTYHGAIYMKKTNDSDITKITSVADLNSLP